MCVYLCVLYELPDFKNRVCVLHHVYIQFVKGYSFTYMAVKTSDNTDASNVMHRKWHIVLPNSLSSGHVLLRYSFV